MLDPKYNPMCKEYHEEAKRLGLTGYKYAQKLIKEGKLSNPKDLHREQKNKTAKNAGFENNAVYQQFIIRKKGFEKTRDYQDFLVKKRGYKDIAEYDREMNWNRGESSPMSENEDCPYYLGVHKSEREIARKILPTIFGNIEKEMSPNFPGYDFIVKGGYKVNIKSRKLIDNKWYFMIRYNNMSDYFLLIGFNNVDKDDMLGPTKMWLFKKDDIIRRYGGTFCMVEFYKRHGFGITNEDRYLKKFLKYEIDTSLFINKSHDDR